MTFRAIVSGNTGFLGSYVDSFLKKKNIKVLGLTRTNKEFSFDLTTPLLDIPEKIIDFNPNAFVHIAALYDMKAQKQDLYQQNVIGTRNALMLAYKLGIKNFVYVSTIAVTSNLTKQNIMPNDIDDYNAFPDWYGETKAQAECLVRQWQSKFEKVIIFRPGILIGDSLHGKIMRIDGPYYFIEWVRKNKRWLEKLKNLPLILPGNQDVTLPMLPVDIAAKAIVEIINYHLNHDTNGCFFYHITPQEPLLLKHFYASVFNHFKLSNKLVITPHLRFQFFNKIISSILSVPPNVLKYAYNNKTYDIESTNLILGNNWGFSFKNYEKTFWNGYEKFISHIGA
ncbi:MAG: SDR family oxidoreductase [Bdellovibrionaceae bacterium]|nr:SDR family oxidoreductase [Pseudobdellovibrionaceae bacterium]MDW8189493.1 SDR family oxidoreductase [Pseudobdellovibrionaceae bacterium]